MTNLFLVRETFVRQTIFGDSEFAHYFVTNDFDEEDEVVVDVDFLGGLDRALDIARQLNEMEADELEYVLEVEAETIAFDRECDIFNDYDPE